MRFWRILPLLLLLALVAATGCGRKGNLIPRDETRPADELLPAPWNPRTPATFGAELGVDGLFEKAGDPERIRGRDLTPEPSPIAPPAEPPDDDPPNDEENPQ